MATKTRKKIATLENIILDILKNDNLTYYQISKLIDTHAHTTVRTKISELLRDKRIHIVGTEHRQFIYSCVPNGFKFPVRENKLLALLSDEEVSILKRIHPIGTIAMRKCIEIANQR